MNSLSVIDCYCSGLVSLLWDETAVIMVIPHPGAVLPSRRPTLQHTADCECKASRRTLVGGIPRESSG
jgi:hypothetical protein